MAENKDPAVSVCFSVTIDDNEIGQVLEVLKGKLLFRHLAEEQGTSRAAWLEAWYCERLKRKHALAVNGGTITAPNKPAVAASDAGTVITIDAAKITSTFDRLDSSARACWSGSPTSRRTPWRTLQVS